MILRNLVPAAFVVALVASLGCTKILGIDKDYVETTGKTSTGAGGSTSSGTQSGTGGEGGTMAPTPCFTPQDCPGSDNECVHRTCENGYCGRSFAPMGTVLAAQLTGDCKKSVCDGKGKPEHITDDSDVLDDSNPCTINSCADGAPAESNAAAGTPCGEGLTCDGNGNCAGCTAVTQCPGMDNDCQTRACTSTLCGFQYAPVGTMLSQQTAGDCRRSICNGKGQTSVIQDVNDPEDDGNPCTVDSCSNGAATHTNAAAGVACTGKGGNVCDGTGKCVECLVADNCPGLDDECHTRTCNGGSCGTSPAPQGTMVALQTPGDCKRSVCDGAGGITGVPDDLDTPTDGNDCTSDSCSVGVPTFTNLPQGTTCGAQQSCNASGQCFGCVTAGQCPGTDNACQTRTCNNNICGMTYVPVGTLAGSQAIGDCKRSQCDGMGAIVVVADDNDAPDDGNPCTKDVCSGGVASHPPAPAGTGCLGGYCNGSGGCGECIPGSSMSGCCVFESTTCCFQTAQQGASPDEVPNKPPDPIEPCCCSGTQICDGSGHYGGCF